MGTTGLGEAIRVGPIEIRFRLEASQTAGSVTMFEFVVPRGARVPAPHSHHAFDEAVYGLAGVTAWTVEGRAVEVGPGDVLFIRRGSVHHFENRGTADARMLSVITPGLLGPEYFRDIGAVVRDGGPPDLGQVRAVMQRHGLRPVPPTPQAACARLAIAPALPDARRCATGDPARDPGYRIGRRPAADLGQLQRT